MKIKLPYGTTQENNQLLLPEGLLSVDVERKAMRLHDGVTLGGVEVVGQQAWYPPPPGQAEWTLPGVYSWTPPDGITLVSCVVIGPGERPPVSNLNTNGYPYRGYAGRGGGLRYRNNIPVVPGYTYTVTVGSGGEVDTVEATSNIPALRETSEALGLIAGVGGEGTILDATGGIYGGVGGGGFVQNTTNPYGGNAGRYDNGTTTPGSRYDVSGSVGSGYGSGIYGPDGTIRVADSGGGGYGFYYPSSGARKAYRAGHGAVRIMWGVDRAYPSLNTGNQ